MHYELLYGGGLGDIFYQMYHRGSYNTLRDLKPNDTAEVYIVCHNPYAKELFTIHPKTSQIKIHDCGYWGPEEDLIKRQKYNIPSTLSNGQLPVLDNCIEYTIPESEKPLVESVMEQKYILMAASAGMDERNFPPEIFDAILKTLLEKTDYYIVPVGRTYDRNGGHIELIYPHNYRILNCIDKLSVPSTAALMQEARGLVTSHSALNILGWLERVPQLLLYPSSMLKRHYLNNQTDQWTFGFNYPETVRSTFEEFNPELIEKFITKLL